MLCEESTPLCLTTFSCWSMTVCDCGRALQTWIPSYHVWWSFALLAPPQVLNHEPPWPQQLNLPDFPMVPHLGHAETAIVVVSDGVFIMRQWLTDKEINIYDRHCLTSIIIIIIIIMYQKKLTTHHSKQEYFMNDTYANNNISFSLFTCRLGGFRGTLTVRLLAATKKLKKRRK